MRKFVVVASAILISACQASENPQDERNSSNNGAAASRAPSQGSLAVVTACPTGKQANFGENVICEEGDPAVIASLPDWAKPPKAVKILNTSVNEKGVGYAAEYEGALSDIEPIYRSQIEREEGVRLAPQDGSKMLVGARVGDTSGTYLSLTPIQKSSGTEKVEIRFYQRIMWRKSRRYI